MNPNNNIEIKEFAEKIELLFSEKRYRDIKNELSELEPVDIADVLEEFSTENLILMFRLLPKGLASEVFIEFLPETASSLINSFSDKEISEMLGELYYDDTVDLIEEMPANVVKKILKNVDEKSRKIINELLQYPETGTGSIMTTEYVGLRPSMTVGEALDHIRSVAIEKETIYTCYVLDRKMLVGIVSAKDLLISKLDKKISDIMETGVISVSAYADKEEAAHIFERYDFLALPVVDKESRMVGIITFDDVMDVLREEAEEDFAKMAATTPGDKPYMKTSAVEIWKKRIPWLLLLMASATFTGMIISSFEAALAAQIALTSFIPMLMGTGGNSGSQSSVAAIRGLSLGEIKFSDVFRVMWKEFRVSILCGVTLAVVTFIKILLFDNLVMGSGVSIAVAGVVCITLALTVVCAKLIGSVLPILADKIGLDPAVMASPFITTLVDALSLLIYFGMASALLGI